MFSVKEQYLFEIELLCNMCKCLYCHLNTFYQSPSLYSIIFDLMQHCLRKILILFFSILPKTEWHQIFHKNMMQHNSFQHS